MNDLSKFFIAIFSFLFGMAIVITFVFINLGLHNTLTGTFCLLILSMIVTGMNIGIWWNEDEK
jgi:high-affinity Fe2+/Pb2+ permease